jgi:hypothetical protein
MSTSQSTHVELHFNNLLGGDTSVANLGPGTKAAPQPAAPE